LNTFKKYGTTENGVELMNPEGVTKFFGDLGIDLMDPLTLIISWKLNAKKCGYYSKEEFVSGMGKLNCN
jgi:hypothetical protein